VAGYSGTPLDRKLGIKEGSRVGLVNEPAGFSQTLAWPPGAHASSDGAAQVDLVLLFVHHEKQLRKEFPRWAAKLTEAGALWVAWPKLAARKKQSIDSDVTDDTVRAVALLNGFVDVKVCAIDETWSGLKCVLRVENRSASARRR